MAVVFISPKERQKMFFLAILILLVLFLVSVSLIVFLAKPEASTQSLVFNKPKVSIDVSIFDSDQFKNLQPFTQMEIQYTYQATAKDGKQIEGFISAISKDEAQKMLIDSGLTVTDLKESQIGRDNPFTPYFETPGSSSLLTNGSSVTNTANTNQTNNNNSPPVIKK